MQRDGEAQMELPMLHGHGDESCGVRLWVMAAEAHDESRLGEMLGRSRHRYRHAFVDAESGSSPIAHSDLIMIRSGTGKFRLLVPEAAGEDERTGRIVGALEGMLRAERLRARRRLDTVELIAITFSPGTPSGGGTSAHKRQARTGLERFLMALATAEAATTPDLTLPVCSTAEDTLDDMVHPALRGLFRRNYADSLWRYAVGSDAEGEAAVGELRRAYAAAARDFERCCFEQQMRSTRRNASSVMGQLAEPTFPGFGPVAAPNRPWLGFGVRRAFAVPLEIDLPRGLRPGETGTGYYVGSGEFALGDAALLTAMSGGVTGRTQIASEATEVGEGLRVRLSVKSEFEALLGLPARQRPDMGGTLLLPWSSTMRFDRDVVELDRNGRGEFHAYPRRPGRHALKLRTLAGPATGMTVYVDLPKTFSGRYR